MNYFNSLFSFKENRFLFQGPEQPSSPPEPLPHSPEVPPVPIDNLASSDPEKEKQNASKEVAKASEEQREKVKADVDFENGMENIGDAESASNTQENADATADQSFDQPKQTLWTSSMDKFGEVMEKAGKMWEKVRHQLAITFAPMMKSMRDMPMIGDWIKKIEKVTDPKENMVYATLKNGGISVEQSSDVSEDTKAVKRIVQLSEKFQNKYSQLKADPEAFHEIAVLAYSGTGPLGKKENTTLGEYAEWLEKDETEKKLEKTIKEQFNIVEPEAPADLEPLEEASSENVDEEDDSEVEDDEESEEEKDGKDKKKGKKNKKNKK